MKSYEIVELSENPTLEQIRSYFEPMSNKRIEFRFGKRKAWAKRYFSYGSSGLVLTNYLHIYVQVGLSESTTIHYREQRNGNFKTV